MKSIEIVAFITKLALAKKAFKITQIDIRQVSPVADFFIIISGFTDIHLRAIADNIVAGLKKKNVVAWHVEGYENAKWILIDFVDVVVHIFDEKTREYYSLERIWGDAPMKEIG